jgi:phenylacetate-CoA ligase
LRRNRLKIESWKNRLIYNPLINQESIRWSKFQAMLDELAGQNSFQLAHWPQLREISQLSGFDQFSEQCPFTTKDKLAKDRMDHPPYGTNLTYPLNHYTRFHQTSGTLGVPDGLAGHTG